MNARSNVISSGLEPGSAVIAPADMDLGTLLQAVWRGKWATLALAGLGALAGLVVALYATVPLYRATAVVVLDHANEQVVQFTELLPSLGGDTTLINTELEVLRSASLMADVVESEALLGDPEFNPSLRAAGLSDRLLGALGRWLPAAQPPLSEELERHRTLNATIAALMARVTTRNVPDTMVFEITVQTTDPLKSARLANAIAERYLARQLATKFASTERATEWLSDKVAELEVALVRAEAETNRFEAEMELISPETLALLSQQLKETRDRIEARQQALDRGETGEDALVRIDQLRSLEADLAEKIARQGQDLLTFEQLQRESAASREIYEYFLARMKETSVQQGIQQADARLMSEAMIPDRPSHPRPTLQATVWGFFAALAGIALAVVREARSATFRTADDLEEFARLPVLGQLPKVRGRGRKRVLDYIRSRPNSAVVESVRNLRTSLVMSQARRAPQVIVSTSSLPSEGKTTQTLALAQNYRGLKEKVLVIEGDVRRQVFHSYFDRPSEGGGLTEAIANETPLQDAVWSDPETGLDLLFGGETSANPADVLSSDGFSRLIRDARDLYDIVLIDTPPALLVPDARIVARHADAVIYCVRWDKTRRRQLREGLKAFAAVSLPITGLVLTQINPRGMRRYGYGQDYGTYGRAGYYAN